MRLFSQLARPRSITYGAGIIFGLYALLAIPDSSPSLPSTDKTSLARPFVWNQDARWDSLEADYVAARKLGCDVLRADLGRRLKDAAQLTEQINRRRLMSSAPEFPALESRFFSLAPLVATCPDALSDYLALSSHVRDVLKRQSEHWDMKDRMTRETLYRLLYGCRSAVEEVILQEPRNAKIPPLLQGADEPSAGPSAMLLGVRVHSGDILVSRGGAPTSALIARGNDFPGNFSHIALVYVDSASGRLSIIESHIERGVVVSTPDEYLHDTKLRVMVLRLRSDLPQLKSNPKIPHLAATYMRDLVLRKHIPYDFEMDDSDTTQMFCSEVASSAYRAYGINLWMGMSHISSEGLRRWLADFGVRHFETQEPSDLEYDPQLRVVAEWRDVETLRKDHIDNAVTEAMLEGADRGDLLHFDWYMLPIARLVKGYCAVINLFDKVGPIPEGMTPTAALKSRDYSARHEAAVAIVRLDAVVFEKERGIEPPYWELLRMARKALR